MLKGPPALFVILQNRFRFRAANLGQCLPRFGLYAVVLIL